MRPGVVVLLILVIALPSVIMGAAVYIAPRAIPWAHRRAARKRARSDSRRRG